MRVRAAVLTGVNTPFQVTDVDLAPPRSREVLVKIAASGLCGSDLNVISGKRTLVPFPVVLGHEASGVVVECGPDVERMRRGDSVVLSIVPSCGTCGACELGRRNYCAIADAAMAAGAMLDGTRRLSARRPGTAPLPHGVVLRRRLGAGMAKLVDANSGFSARRAIQVGRLLAAEGVTHFEEPCPYWQLAETKRVTDTLAIDVTGGEQDWDIATWQRIIGGHVVDIVQPDIMYMGGLWRTLQVANAAARAGVPCTPHCANLSLVTMATMHMLAAIPNAGQYLELSIEGADYYPWQVGLFRGDPFAVTAGHVLVPDEPGWGVEIDARWLDRSAYQASGIEQQPAWASDPTHRGSELEFVEPPARIAS